MLVSFGYLATCGIFAAMVFVQGKAPEDAYDLIQGPLMTLIGGTLAIAKDLLNSEGSEQKNEQGGAENGDEGGNGQT